MSSEMNDHDLAGVIARFRDAWHRYFRGERNGSECAALDRELDEALLARLPEELREAARRVRGWSWPFVGGGFP